jgi:hypothetical protein
MFGKKESAPEMSAVTKAALGLDDVTNVPPAVESSASAPASSEPLTDVVEAEVKRRIPAEMLTPASVGTVNDVVREAVRSLFAEFAPILKDLALSPEKIKLMEDLRRAPTPEQEAFKARMKREKLATIAEQQQNARNLAAAQAACKHKHKTGASAIQVVMNQLDQRPRGICAKCQIWLHPAEWRVAAPTAANPSGEYIHPAHPLFHLVLDAIQEKQE